MSEIIEIIEQTKKDFKDFFELPKDKKERKEFILSLFGGCLMLGVCYVLFMMIYFLAPAGYWNGF